MSKPVCVSVSQVNRLLAMLIKGENRLQDVYIKGEISNFVNHYKSGHLYFTLKDETSSIKAVMFKSYAQSLKFMPENGMSVIVRGAVQVYEAGGVYQIYVTEITADGVGDLYLAYEQLKERLQLEGLFAQKRQLPLFPRKICVITASTGAAIQDMINIISRRWPAVKLVLIPTLVQGVSAPDSICSAFTIAQSTDADLIIFGRGGGSIEDLWAFNDERVAKAVFSSAIPTISAVGHETDFTIGDFVADLRAPTPSAAAELAVPDFQSVIYDLEDKLNSMKLCAERCINKQSAELDSIEVRMKLLMPQNKLITAVKRINELNEGIRTAFISKLRKCESELNGATDTINALNPMNVLSRGYSVVCKNDRIVSKTADLTVGDEIEIKLSDGSVSAVIK